METGLDVDAIEQSRRTFEAVAKLAAKLQDGMRERAVVHGPRTPLTLVPAPHTQQPGTQHAPGRISGGVM
ncbi:hypothetical protein N7U49_48235 (plasmid) [Streptomyces sp. AD2-2]|nr:hypothetical protein N7U49_48235 [Streptomyces sp. AD2-2]